MQVVDHRPALNVVLETYGLPPQTLELVPSVADWQDANLPENNDLSGSRAAICFHDVDGAFHIIMREEVSRLSFDGHKKVMQRDGFAEKTQILTTEKLCLLHLLLHEVAFHVLGTDEQKRRDEWAFNELAKFRYFWN